MKTKKSEKQRFSLQKYYKNQNRREMKRGGFKFHINII